MRKKQEPIVLNDVDPENTLSRAATDVLAERQRQVKEEGWDAAHDDEHDSGELALAAACYAAPARIFVAEQLVGRGYEPYTRYADAWPWNDRWWKPKDRRRDLVRAAALLLAEIERLDRSGGRDG